MIISRVVLPVAGTGLVLVAIACASGGTGLTEGITENITPTFTPHTLPAESTLTIAPQETTQPPTSLDDTEALRILAFAYWEALNLYDLEKTVSYLEENYREVHRDEVNKGIRQMRLFRVQLGLSEESQPRFTGPNEAKMYMTLKEPLGTRRILMEFAKVEGEWMITFAEEID